MKIISWNIACLPWYINFFKDPYDRFTKIIDYILYINPDIICLQEVFISKFRTVLEYILNKKGYNVLYNNCSIFFNSGLFFATKYKITNYNFISFNNCNCGEDSIVNKGYFIVEINNNYQCYITHLQADPIFTFFSNSTSIRKEQLDLLISNINNNNNKYILLGDFNILRNTYEYTYFLSKLKHITNNIYINNNNIYNNISKKDQVTNDYIIFLNFNFKKKPIYKIYPNKQLSDHSIIYVEI